MQLTINIKESAYDKIMYLLSHLKDDVTIVKEIPNHSLKQNKQPNEVVDFLELGGSSCWDGNLEVMREDRIDYGTDR